MVTSKYGGEEIEQSSIGGTPENRKV